MNQNYIQRISIALGIGKNPVENVLKLLEEGATIPFIARYRKEMTGTLDEVQISNIQKEYHNILELEARRKFILESIEEQGKLTPELNERITKAKTLIELEDLYLPYKRKKKTKADVARNLGLEPLALAMISQSISDLTLFAKKFVTADVPNIETAIEGAKDIIAELISEDEAVRNQARKLFHTKGQITSKVLKSRKEEAGLFQDYFDFSEPIARCPSHRFLAISRGDDEGFLRVSIAIDQEDLLHYIRKNYIKQSKSYNHELESAFEDGVKRLLLPSIENQIRTEYKAKADTEAIKVFTQNLRQLLLAAPLGEKRVLAIDPGYRTGCKIVCLSAQGDLLEKATIFPHLPQKQERESIQTIKFLVEKYGLEAIAIGNGTASRETKALVDSITFPDFVPTYVVSESGASIYSASEIAREEFPHEDVTVRGSISIGRRLMDPLAELVKVDPKSIGVGQYQHDVNQTMLKTALDETVVYAVNSVGVNLNTASKHLLTYVSGLGPSIAQNIVQYRSEVGPFNSRSDLLKVPRLGPKAYEQSAGFLRVKNGKNPLDNSAVHPESYSLVEQIAQDHALSTAELIGNQAIIKKIDPRKYVNEKIGLPTIVDILKELSKPGLDPRGEAQAIQFDDRIKKIEDLHPDLILHGVVNNLTNFGAFVDIGLKESGLLHISNITNKFIKSPSEVLSLGQSVMVKVIDVDLERKRINLTMKSVNQKS